MKLISSSFSHTNLDEKNSHPDDRRWAAATPWDAIARSEARKVQTYDDLVTDVAQIMFYNRNLALYYRGQSKDYKKNGMTTLLPTIYRKKEGERLMLKEKFALLEQKVDDIKRLFSESEVRYEGISMLKKYPEIAWSLLQHYEICETPLLDITHSLHVACSFAFDRNKAETGIVYVLGMPWQTDGIGYNTYEELLNVKLLGVCPPQAQRPFFQEGYLAGPFPNYQLDNTRRVPQFDFARRLIAKFEIPIDPSFWGDGFGRIPSKKLYQPKDKIFELLSGKG